MKITWKPSPNFNTPAQTKDYYGVSRTIKYIVIHWWDNPAKKPVFSGVVSHLTNPKTKVSAHYVVEDNKIYQLVKEEDTAWHAAKANPYSIGIECNPRQSSGDYKTIAWLVAAIWKRYGKLPIYPHKKFVATSCPGTYDLNKIAKLANAILNPPKPVPAPKPAPQEKEPDIIHVPVVSDSIPDEKTLQIAPQTPTGDSSGEEISEKPVKGVVEVEESKQFTLNVGDFKSIGIGALLAIGGALVAYFSDAVTQIDFGQWAYIAIPVASILINALRKFLEGKSK